MIVSKTTHLEKILLIVWFVANLIMGVLTIDEYGISIDEPNNHRYAADTLDAYPSFFGTLYKPKYNPTYDGHGPAFVSITAIAIKIIQGVFPNAVTTDLWHFSYFITFQLAGLCLYWLTKRWFNTWTAWGILILFGTQPLLLGHAFINPKDIPFMFLLILSIVLGFRLVDSMEAKEPFFSLESTLQPLKNNYQATEPRRKRNFYISLVLGLGITLAIALFSNQINSLVERIVMYFYAASSDSWAGLIFGSVASRASEVSAADYATKVLRLLHRAETALLRMGLLFFMAYFGLLVSNTTLPTILRNTWNKRFTLREFFLALPKLLRDFLTSGWLITWITNTLRALANPRLIFAGIALGLATGLRAIAPWAGVIVCLYLFVKARSRAWPTVLAYFLIAGIVTYLAWPYLWEAPVHRYLAGLGVISDFQTYPQRVLFKGRLYPDTALPRSYLPILLNIQLTETYLLGVYMGLGVLIWRLLHGRLRVDLLLYISLGFVVPFVGLILLNPPLYNNFRQVLFLIPAMTMFAAFALELIFRKMTHSWVRVLFITVIALPGIYSSIKLYPYEYIYYNSLVSSTNYYQRYELDYMRIALREAALELNKIAPSRATVVVTRSAGLFSRYSRPDLIIDKRIDSILNLDDQYDYSVQLARGKTWDIFPDTNTVVIIKRGDMVLAIVKDMKNASKK